jgi:hypothetical protein
MKLTKKSLIQMPAGILLLLISAQQVFADTPINPIGGENKLLKPAGEVDINFIVQWVIIVLTSIGILAALVWLILGAIKWIISGGDADKVKAAREQIIASIIGLIILLLAVVILNFAIGFLGLGTGIFDLNIPTFSEGINAG